MKNATHGLIVGNAMSTIWMTMPKRLIGLFFIGFFSVNAFSDVGPNWIEQWGIRWTFDKNISLDDAPSAYHYGHFVNGDYWVLIPKGGDVRVTKIEPQTTEITDSVQTYGNGFVHGSMLNPETSKLQGYDTRRSEVNNAQTNAIYNAAWGVSPETPLIISSPASLVSMESKIPYVVHNFSLKAAVLTFLSEAPPANSFRPPYVGTDKTIKYNKSDLDYSVLKEMTKPSTLSSTLIANITAKFNHTWLDHFIGIGSRWYHPSDNMLIYGADIAEYTAQAALILNLDLTTSAEKEGKTSEQITALNNTKKENLLIYYTQVGIDFGAIPLSPGYDDPASGNPKQAWLNNGGHQGGRKLPILFASLVLGDPDLRALFAKGGSYLYNTVNADGYPNPYGPSNPPADYIHFQEDDQVYSVSKFHYDITNNLIPGYSWIKNETNDIPFVLEDIGNPEWSQRNSDSPRRSTAYMCAQYRSINSSWYPATVLAIYAMGGKELWNHDVFFDYTDRWVNYIRGVPDVEKNETQKYIDSYIKDIKTWVLDIWDANRSKFGPTWTERSTIQIPVTLDPAAHWPFDKPYQSAASDIVSGQSAPLANDPVWGDGWAREHFIRLDSGRQAIQVPMSQCSPAAGTIALWAMPENSSDMQVLFGHALSSTANRIAVYLAAGKLAVGLGDTLQGNIATLAVGQMQHVAVTWLGTRYAVYVNGIEKAAGTFGGLTQLNAFADVGNYGNAAYYNDGLGFRGVVADVQLYSKSLVAKEIKALFLTHTIRENRPIDFVISGRDLSGNPIRYTANDLPQGAVFDSQTQTFYWRPALYNAAGRYNLRFTAAGQPEQIVTVLVQDVGLAGWYRDFLVRAEPQLKF
jgi:hypothetical protein